MFVDATKLAFGADGTFGVVSVRLQSFACVSYSPSSPLPVYLSNLIWKFMEKNRQIYLMENLLFLDAFILFISVSTGSPTETRGVVFDETNNLP